MSNPIVFSRLIAKVAFLKIPPEAWDAIIPHSLRWKQQYSDYAAAGLVRDIARHVDDRALQDSLLGLGREMAGSAAKGFLTAYDDDGELCPPWFRHFPPIPHGGGGGDGGDPWPIDFNVGAVRQLVLADMLLSLAGVTSHAGFSKQLRATAGSLAEGAAKNVGAEFGRSGINQR